MASNRRLTPEQQAFIVRANARFLSPEQVRWLVKEEYGIEIVREHIRAYNPRQVQTAKKWVQLFEEERTAFLSTVADIGLSHAAYRLAARQRLFDRVMDKINAQEHVNPQLLSAAQSLLDGARDEAAMLLGAGGAAATSAFLDSPNGIDLSTASRLLDAGLAVSDAGKLLPYRKRAA